MGNSRSQNNPSYLLSESDNEPPATFSYDIFQQTCESQALPFQVLEPHYFQNFSRGLFPQDSRLGLMQHIQIQRSDNLGFARLYNYIKVLEFLKEKHPQGLCFGFCGVETLNSLKEKGKGDWSFGVRFEGLAIASLAEILANRQKARAFYSIEITRRILSPLFELVSELNDAGLKTSSLKVSPHYVFLTQKNNGDFAYRLAGFELETQSHESKDLESELLALASEMTKGSKGKGLFLRDDWRAGVEEAVDERGFFEFLRHEDRERLRLYIDLLERNERFRPAAEILEEFLAKNGTKTDSVREEVYWLNRLAIMLRKTGKANKSLAVAEKALKLLANLEESGVETGYLLNNVGVLLADMGRESEGRALLCRARELLSDVGKSRKTLRVLTNLAESLWACGDYKSSVSLQIEVFNLKRALFPDDSQLLTSSLNNLALSLSECGEAKLALRFLSEIKSQDDCNSEVKAALLNSLGCVCFKIGDKQKAIEFFGKAIETYEILGVEEADPRLFKALKNLSCVFLTVNEREKARNLLLKARKASEKGGFYEDVREELQCLIDQTSSLNN